MTKQSAFLMLTVAALMLGACERQPTEAGAPASSSATPSAPTGPIQLAAGQVKVLIAPQGAGAMNPATGKFEIPVKITNKGPLALSSRMDRPVNVGVQILPAKDGTGGLVDFTRTPLPEIKPGQTLLVNVAVPVDHRVDGHDLKIELVQEHVAWFASLGQPGVKVGPYGICGDALCPGGGK
jgi:hypothetical protein